MAIKLKIGKFENSVILNQNDFTVGNFDNYFNYGKSNVGGLNTAGLVKPLILTIDTTKAGSASDTFILPTTGSGYDATVDWGDDSSEVISGTPGDVSHVYSSSGTYAVSILENVAGGFPQIYFNLLGDRQKLLAVNFGTNQWSSFEGAFLGCSNLSSVSATPNMSAVTNMSDIFNQCTLLTTIDLFGWDISNVTDMTRSFASCSTLTSINLSGVDTSSVENMSGTFSICSIITTIDMSGLDTSNVENMSSMFIGCTLLTTIDVSGLDTSSVTTMLNMFRSLPNLASLDVSGFDTSSVTTMSGMFRSCTILDVDVSGFDITLLASASSMMNSSAFSQTNYDKLLVAWDAFGTSNVPLHAGTAQYGVGAPAEAHVAMALRGWTFTDGGPAV